MQGKKSYRYCVYYFLVDMITQKTLYLKTVEGISVYDLTEQVKEIVTASLIKNGCALIFTKHTTTAIRINEKEDRLLEDMKLFLEKIAPKNGRYLHDDILLRDCPPDERMNGHAHLKALCLNASETIPLIDSELALGKWQSILFLEFDGARDREIIVQVTGE